jgi:predicted N-formylglutamate amidohydrolase
MAQPLSMRDCTRRPVLWYIAWAMQELAHEPIDAPAGRLIFVCDHASNALPQGYGTLGLEDGTFATHIAYDIGAAEVARTLAGAFQAPAVLARWSRLLIDLNRGRDDPTLVMQLSDGHIIPGNRDVPPAEISKRLAAFHAPYHAAIEAEIARSHAVGIVPAIVSIHSFTPVWKGKKRPWEIGVLWDRDARLASPLLAGLARARFSVGDNQPYSGELENDCLYVHGTMNGLPHALIEIRQDLIATKPDQVALALQLKSIIMDAMTQMGEPAIRFTRPTAQAKRHRSNG